MKRAVRRADHELKPGGANRYDPGDGLAAVEHDDGLAAADRLKVLAQVGFEVSSAYGGHDHMIVMRVLQVNHGKRGCSEIAALAEPCTPGIVSSSVLNPDPSPYPNVAVSGFTR